MKSIFLFIGFFTFSGWMSVHPDATDQYKMVEAVNKIRQNGCYCGRRYMAPAQKVVWDETLYRSAFLTPVK
ncbi:MAG: hypothetical protein IPO92_11030 [Saprospiraceae bacterium]|nr:hypothetical protein [Saprospiraceae bacterium]